MQIRLINNLEELAPYAEDWDRLAAGIPFRGWTWLSEWWRCYGQSNGTRCKSRLAVLAVFDEAKALIGVAPWYSFNSITHGRVMRMLGDGEVCSDYLSLLCHRGMEDMIARAVADFLLDIPVDHLHEGLHWDLIKLDGVDFEDLAVNRLAANMVEQGCTVHKRSGLNCWQIDLPATWEEYINMLSKKFRGQVRRLERAYFENGAAILHEVQRIDELPAAMDLFVDLHQRRRKMLGEPGCFSSSRFTSFIRGGLPELMRQGQAKLFWLELNGRPIAAEYHLAGNGVLYTYQSGVEPEAMDLEPGKLLNLAIIRLAIEQGYRKFDFLRGDEPYKAHFRAAARPSLEIRIVPNRVAARFRHGLWLAGRQVKQWIKKGVRGEERGPRERGTKIAVEKIEDEKTA
jgi:CelD/BcsL family acetyltransferase involved in cellulose biosynthesis